MKIGIISDSHDHLRNIRKSTDVFKQRRVGFVLHLGDFISPNAIKAFKGLKLVGIFGNNDGDKFRLIKECNDSGGEIKGDLYFSLCTTVSMPSFLFIGGRCFG